MGKGDGATCECGQVLFDTGGRKAGDKLLCPWCRRRYRYLGDEKIELIGNGGGMEACAEENKAKASKAGKSQKKEREKEKDSKGREEREEGSGVSSIVARSKSVERTVARSGRTAEVKPVEGESRRDGTGETRRTKKPAEIPGGALMMVVFIVAFNALAFLLLAIAMPRLPSGVRQPVWGGADIPKSAVWPELAALLLGHVLGFFAWSWYAYQLLKFKQLERQMQAQDAGKPGGKRARGEAAERR